jgi:ABC-type amino acid transport substrate-binding protein
LSARARVLALACLGATAALALTGCSSGKKVEDTKKSASVSVAKQASLHDLLPAAIKSKGVLTMATDPSYAPIEFTKSGGGFQGFDIDLANAIGTTLGVKVDIKKAQFDGILAGINAGRYDFSMSAFTDNTAREKGNDFVTYFKAGTSIGVKKGNPKHIQSQNDLCGLRVGAEKGTIQATALTATTAEGAITLKGQCCCPTRPASTPRSSAAVPTRSPVTPRSSSTRARSRAGRSSWPARPPTRRRTASPSRRAARSRRSSRRPSPS